MQEFDLCNHTIICYEFRGELFSILHELDLYHHTIIGYEFRVVLFSRLQ